MVHLPTGQGIAEPYAPLPSLDGQSARFSPSGRHLAILNYEGSVQSSTLHRQSPFTLKARLLRAVRRGVGHILDARWQSIHERPRVRVYEFFTRRLLQTMTGYRVLPVLQVSFAPS